MLKGILSIKLNRSIMIKIINFVGARPQFIKAAPISREIKKHTLLKEIIVHSGQHYDDVLSKNFFNELKIPKPKYNLNVGSKDHANQIAIIITRLTKIFDIEKPDWLIVYGDTNTTLAGSIAGNRSGIKVAHIESGIRSYNKDMPEEINRVVTDKLSDILFCPTKKAITNLNKENIKENIFLVGDVMYDNFKYYSNFFKTNILEQLKLKKNKYLLVTIHRSQNTNNHKRLSNRDGSFNYNKLANTFSFINTLKQFLLTSKNNCIIFEDDLFIPNSNEVNLINIKLNLLFKKINKKWQYINLGRCWDESCNIKYKKEHFEVTHCLPVCTHAIILKRDIAYNLISNTLPLSQPKDNTWRELIHKNSYWMNYSYCIVPSIFSQDRNKLTSTLGNFNSQKECSGNTYTINKFLKYFKPSNIEHFYNFESKKNNYLYFIIILSLLYILYKWKI